MEKVGNLMDTRVTVVGSDIVIALAGFLITKST